MTYQCVRNLSLRYLPSSKLSCVFLDLIALFSVASLSGVKTVTKKKEIH